jgi:hypothetical protein
MRDKRFFYRLIALIVFALVLSKCSYWPGQLREAQATPTAGPTYYVANNGNDSNAGTSSAPWLTLRKAIRTVGAGSTVYIRAGSYDAASTSTAGGSQGFLNSGTEANPITVTNYPGEAVIIHQNGKNAFSCWWTEAGGATYGYNKINYIRIIGTDVSPRTLSNGISSKKGIVIQGENIAHNYPITAFGCDHWEIAGIDFFDVAAGIRTWKQNYSEMVDNSSDYWYVHDNRVYSYSGESGMQFDGNNNTIVNNEIYKTLNVVNTPYGCSTLNLNGNNNLVSGNIFSRKGSNQRCFGMIFEWDMADNNLIENNQMLDFDETAVYFAGGDTNTIQNNIMIARNNSGSAFSIESENGATKTDWPCNDFPGSGSTSEELLPPNNPAHYDYQYYFPHDCRSKNNKILNNVISGFGKISTIWGGYTETSTIFQGNVTSLPTGTPATSTPQSATITATASRIVSPTYTMTLSPTATRTIMPSAVPPSSTPRPTNSPTLTFTNTPTAIPPTITPTSTATTATALPPIVTATFTPMPPSPTITPMAGPLCIKSVWTRALNERPAASMSNLPLRIWIEPNAIIPIEAMVTNNEGTFAQINWGTFAAMKLNSNGRTYAVLAECK